jgi:hypothetical protein
MAAADSSRMCAHCGRAFRGAKQRRYCTLECRASIKRERRKSRGYPTKPLLDACCIACGKAYRTRHREQRYCSKVCSWAFRRKPFVVANWHGHCAQCGAKFHGKRPRKHCGDNCEKVANRLLVRTKHKPRPCRVCGVEFTPTFRVGPAMLCCSPACDAERIRRAKRAAKSGRRARMRGAEAEAIDPIKVFERDKWRCHLCGTRTPKRLRGSCDQRAPELDHVVALADGGSHTWGNVACACRRCNGLKGARSIGQLGLPLAA